MGISIWQLLIILAIVLVLFGAKRIRNLGSDLGHAVKGFKDAVSEGEKDAAAKLEKQEGSGTTIEGEVTHEKDKA